MGLEPPRLTCDECDREFDPFIVRPEEEISGKDLVRKARREGWRWRDGWFCERCMAKVKRLETMN